MDDARSNNNNMTRSSVVPRHTSMPPRTQQTPHGEVTLTSKWVHDRYYLVAAGSDVAIRWMFPSLEVDPEMHGGKFRHTFQPAESTITVERVLRHVCSRWQAAWDERLSDEIPAAQISESVTSTPQTLRQALDHHQAHYAGLLGARTQEQYPARMSDWFDHLGPDVRLDDITAEKLIAARKTMQQKGASNSTINGKVATLKKILNMAHRKGWVSRAPWRDVPPLRLIRERVRYWDGEQVAVAFAAAREDPTPQTATLMLVLGIHLGLRKNEAANLRWCDLDLERRHPQTGEPSPICVIQQRPGFTTKTYENRKIPVSEECRRLLLENRPPSVQSGDFVLEAQIHRQKHGGTQRIYRYDCVKVWLRVLKRAMAAGNPRIEFKEMRHSFACNCLRQGGHSVEKVARWLGHKDPRMVRQHYAFLLDYDEDTGLRFLDPE